MIKKKGAKVLMIIFMIGGIVFSTANYLSIDLRGIPSAGSGDSMRGVWKYNQFGEKVCDGKGDECDINGANV